MKLHSLIIIPFIATSNFLDLKYSKITPNIVKLDKVIEISVNESASPLFVKIDGEPKKYLEASVEGEVQIEKEIGNNENDSYFQLGVIYEGNYRPNGFVKAFLPEWILKVLTLSDTTGVSEIDFLDVSNSRELSKSDNIRDIKLNFQTVSHLENGKFKITAKLKDKKVLGFWLRTDGDDSKAKFNLKINRFEVK
ncbi:hypothetical protein [Bacteriovorax sp. Seq25_V]|uniref:hypothetical protein n=1 Tax=Bacteriovorax sp. Seq25_V TaxID=1201288 RepID=UPI0005565EE6|nr:hypothetical protein [Bacteriovorax sp. Seq25_V]